MKNHEPSRVRMLFDDGVCEDVAVSFEGECLCRLEETPMASTTDARLGDVVEFEPEDGVAKMTRIVRRSPFEVVTLVVPSDVMASDAFRDWVSGVEGDGCSVEMAHGGTILVHVLPNLKDSVTRSFEDVRQSG